MEQQIEINIIDIFKSLLRRWWLILLATVIFACGGFAYANIRYVPSYSTTIKMYVNNDSLVVGPTKVSISSGDIAAAQSLVNTYLEILKTHETYEKTMDVIAAGDESLSRDYSYNEFLSMISSGSLNETEIFYITVTCGGKRSDLKLAPDTKPAAANDACLIADAVTVSLVERIENVINSSSASMVEGVHRYSTSTCNDKHSGTVAAAIGFILAAGLALLFDIVINDKIGDEEWLTNFFGEDYPVLSVIPNAYQKDSKKAENYTVQTKTLDTEQNSVSDISFAATEAYNRLRTNIFYSLPEKSGGKIIAITSASPKEGKTFTSTHLAYSMAKEGNRTLLVDCDMRRPSVDGVFKLSRNPGLSDLLVGKEKDVIISNVTDKNLSVVASGIIPPNPSDLLSSPKMKNWLDDMSRKYDYVVLDLPPILAVADPLIVAKYADAIFLVAKHGVTRKKHLIGAMKQLKMTKTHILGFVYNDFKFGGGHYYKNEKYYYAQQYTTDDAESGGGNK